MEVAMFVYLFAMGAAMFVYIFAEKAYLRIFKGILDLWVFAPV